MDRWERASGSASRRLRLPALSALLSFAFRLHDRKLQLPLRRIDAIETHLQSVADGELTPRMRADDLARVLAVGVAIVGKRIDGDQPLDEQVLQLDEQSVLGGADDQGIELIAHAVDHEFHFLPL